MPWRVDQLNLLTTLTNPAIEGHMLRLPLRRLPGLLSRPVAEREPWFPCRLGDWVLLADDTYGRVVELTPEIVQIVKVGGLHKTYPIAAFLALNPANLSWGFRVNSTFGIDYRHQAQCTEEIPHRLREHIFRGLVEMVGHEPIRSLKVEFKAAGASSLDYEILADFDGTVADKLEVLRRAVQRLAVDACNEHGWTIPFMQVTLHQAGEAVRKDSSIHAT
jgi:small-conductance mechanosensitive channel